VQTILRETRLNFISLTFARHNILCSVDIRFKITTTNTSLILVINQLDAQNIVL